MTLRAFWAALLQAQFAREWAIRAEDVYPIFKNGAHVGFYVRDGRWFTRW